MTPGRSVMGLPGDATLSSKEIHNLMRIKIGQLKKMIMEAIMVPTVDGTEIPNHLQHANITSEEARKYFPSVASTILDVDPWDSELKFQYATYLEDGVVKLGSRADVSGPGGVWLSWEDLADF